jgi:cold shock CspA family protein
MVGDAPAAALQHPLVAGTIRQFYPEKGHGFVRLAVGSARDNVFFRRSAVEGATDADLVPGRSVRVIVEDDGRGRRTHRGCCWADQPLLPPGPRERISRSKP